MIANGGSGVDPRLFQQPVNYEKPGYLPVQRKIDAPWADYAWLPDVVMIPVDSRVTTVDLSAADSIQTARGTPVTDEDGTRQATLLFPKGIQAQMVLPDGKTQSLDTLNVRATEYTVGPEGPKMMPGELPPTSAYTYAVEWSVDEAIAARAKKVQFDKPVPFYVDNFLDFPVGGAVPVGWYDREKAAWIPSKNGRIVKILSTAGGLADLDVDGSGKPAGTDALATLGITDDERRELATLYPPGRSLWRTPIEHFTPWDCNWPYAPPEDSEPPPPDEPERDNEDDPDEPNECDGCVIEAENQVLGESIPIVGTPYTLNYRSNRVPGYTPSRVVKIPLSGGEVPRSLKRIDLEIQVAGRVHRQSFPAAPDLHTSFVWDGKDGMGRPVQGAVDLTYRLRFVYQVVYTTPSAFASAFGRAGTGVGIGGNRAAGEVDFSRKHTVVVMAELGGSQLGRWSLTPHHSYSVAGVTLYKGDGSRNTAETEAPNIITTVAGNGRYGFSGDGGSATAARLSLTEGIAVGPDGSLYFADRVNHRIRRVGPDGVITTVAGGGTPGTFIGDTGGFSGDGGPATEALLDTPYDVAVGPDGSLYIAEEENHRIRRVGPDGVITTVAGNGAPGYSGDGGSATEASLFFPISVEVDNDGSIYIADSGRVRRVGPDGIITTVAGTNVTGFSGDGGPAIAASLSTPKGIALGADGSLYITDSHNQRIRRVGPDGIITTVAGKGIFGYDGDGGPATEARLSFPRDVASGSNGSLYVADSNNHRIRWVGLNGIITTVAGTGASGHGGDGGPAVEAQISAAEGVAIGPDGSLYISDFLNYRIRRVTRPTRLLDWNELRVPSADNDENYVFNSEGRHLRTLDSVSGALRHGFSYDAQGYLIALEDGDGNRTTIDRDSTGKPLAIIAPDGQRTELTVDTNGSLTAVTNPAGETHTMAYTAEGLLTGMTKPSGAGYVYEYDSAGRLVRDRDPVGGGWSLARTETENGYEARMTSAEGRISRFGVERLSPTEVLRTTIAPDGTVSTRRIITTEKDITEDAIDADGTRRTQHQSPDPRFGMDAPYVDAATITTPSGLTQIASATREATLADPNDPLSLAALSEATTTNGRTSAAKYQSATRTWTTTSAEGRSIVEVLNAEGRPILTRFADLAAANYDYDSRGRLKALTEGDSEDPRTTSFTYDALGNLETVTDTLGRTTRFDYDLAGRVTKQTMPDGWTIGYHYDPNGNLTALTPPGKEAHLFAYTPVDLEELYTPPDLDGVETLTLYTYNKDKDLTRIERPDGSAIAYAYDSGGRLSAITYPEGRLEYVYLTSGKLASIMRADGHRLDYTYDGFLPLAETATGEVSGTVSRSYDNNFWVNTLAVNGLPVTFGYDDDGLLTSAGGLSLSRNAQNGLLSGTALGVVTTAQTHNAFGELQTESVTVADTNVMTIEYIRDILGRITEKRERIGDQLTAYEYGYDLAGRLETVKTNGVITATYAYDQNGNRLSNGTETGTYDAQDRMTAYAGASYEYTPNGDLKAKTQNGATTRYWYDALGNLLKVELPGDVAIEYLIDGRNRRIGKKVNGKLVQGFLYQDQLNPVAELDGEGNVVARFVYGGKSNVPDYMEKGGKTYRIVSDHLGSPRLVIDAATGEVVQRMAYDEFGNITEDTNAGFQPFGFAGGINDQHIGLVRFGARDYDSRTGRWTSKDPIRYAGGDANLYTYVRGNPINRIDPLGLSDVTYDGGSGTITVHDSQGNQVGQFPAGNNTTSTSNGPWPNGTFPYSHYVPHPESGPTGPYGSNGNFVFDVPGRTGMGIHSGRSGPQSKTLGCIRTTDEATDFLRNLHPTDPLRTITVQ